MRELPDAGAMRMIASCSSGRDAMVGAAFDAALSTPIGQQMLHAALAPVARGGSVAHSLETVPVAPPPSSRRQLRVLLIERNPVHQMLASMMLSREGHAVDVASSGVEAVSLGRAARHDLVLIDLALTDPDGMAAGRRLRAELAAELSGPVIAMAEPNAPRALAEEIAVGVVDIVAKPIDKNQLFAAIARAVPMPAAPEEPSAPESGEAVDVAALRDLAAQLDALKSAVNATDATREHAS